MKLEVAGEEAKQLEGAQTGEFKVTLSHLDVILLGKNLRKCLNVPCKGSHCIEALGGHRSPVTELVGPLPCCSLDVLSNNSHTTTPLHNLNQSLITRCSVKVTLRLGLSPSWEQGARDSCAPDTGSWFEQCQDLLLPEYNYVCHLQSSMRKSCY